MAKINTRSPYFLTYVDADITSAVLDLYIYTGVSVDTMDEVMYSLETEAFNGSVSFEISKLISDHLEVAFNGSFGSNVVWLNYRVTKSILGEVGELQDVQTLPVFDGYGYFEDGAKPQLSNRVLQSNDTIYAYDNNIFHLPVQQDDLDYIDLMYQGEEVGKVVTEGGQNLILYSEQADNAVWTKIGATIDVDAIVSGSYFGDKLGTGTSNGSHLLFQNYTTLGTSQTFTSSFYVKAAEYSKVFIWLSDTASGGTGGDVRVHFDTVTKLFSQETILNSYQLVGYNYTDEGDGWFRVSLTVITNTETTLRLLFGVVNDSDLYTFTGDNGGLYIRGMQLQEGALGTYVETTTVGVDNIGGTTYPNRISFTPTTDSGDVIRYISYTNPKKCLSVVNYLFEDRDNYLFEDANNYIFNDVSFVDAIKVTYTDTSSDTIKINTIGENKHTPYRITFVNKFGALQSVWMFKRSDVSMSVENESYRGYLYNGSSYNVSEHQYRNYNVTARETISLNSGFYTEDFNEVFRQLLLSERVWIDYKNQILPVNIKSKELAFKTQVNDKLIDYKIDFEFAFDKINNVF